MVKTKKSKRGIMVKTKKSKKVLSYARTRGKINDEKKYCNECSGKLKIGDRADLSYGEYKQCVECGEIE